jgi:hypothetical protein
VISELIGMWHSADVAATLVRHRPLVGHPCVREGVDEGRSRAVYERRVAERNVEVILTSFYWTLESLGRPAQSHAFVFSGKN